MTPSRLDRSSADGVSATVPAGKRVGVGGGATPEEVAAVLAVVAALTEAGPSAGDARPGWRRTRIAALARHPHPRTV